MEGVRYSRFDDVAKEFGRERGEHERKEKGEERRVKDSEISLTASTCGKVSQRVFCGVEASRESRLMREGNVFSLTSKGPEVFCRVPMRGFRWLEQLLWLPRVKKPRKADCLMKAVEKEEREKREIEAVPLSGLAR